MLKSSTNIGTFEIDFYFGNFLFDFFMVKQNHESVSVNSKVGLFLAIIFPL